MFGQPPPGPTPHVPPAEVHASLGLEHAPIVIARAATTTLIKGVQERSCWCSETRSGQRCREFPLRTPKSARNVMIPQEGNWCASASTAALSAVTSASPMSALLDRLSL